MVVMVVVEVEVVVVVVVKNHGSMDQRMHNLDKARINIRG